MGSQAAAQRVLNEQYDQAVEELNKLRTASEQSAHDFARAMIEEARAAETFEDAVERLTNRLKKLAEDRLLDDLAGKFSKWVGGTDSNPFAQALTWFFPTNPGAPSEASNSGHVQAATGGLIRGPGTGRSDSILARLSNGEFVVNAAQTAKHLPLLKAINSGPDLPAFATGGLVGSSGGTQAPGGMKVNIYNQASHTEVESRPSADGQGLEITILDVVKGGIMAGQLDRPMRQHFGASPKPQGG